MRRLRAAAWRLGELFSWRRREHALAAELESHLQLHVDDAMRRGLSEAEARREASIALGGIEQTKERYRDRRGFPSLDSMQQDIRYAARTMARNPGFTTIATITLALGIGANSAIFSVVNAVLLRPLPFPKASQLVQIYGVRQRRGQTTTDVASYQDYLDWRDGAPGLESVAAFTIRSLLISDATGAELVQGGRVSPTFFDTVGVRPVLGRAFDAGEDEDGRHRVVILSDGLWRRRFGADPSAIGSTLSVNSEPFTIVGVMPAGFHFAPTQFEQAYIPLVREAGRGHSFLYGLGRLRDGVSVGRLQSQLDIVAKRTAAAYPKTNAGVGVSVVPLIAAMAGPVRFGLLLLLGVVGLVLLIACTNVANLLLSRAATRRRELAMRAALGASRGRILRQLLTESMLLACLGGAAGIAVAQWTGRLLVTLLAKNFRIPRLETTGVDLSVLGFTLVVSIATGVLFGVAPAWAASSESGHGFRESGRSSTGGAPRRLRAGLIVCEIAMAMVLLASAGALLKTLITLRNTQPGFDTSRMVVTDFWLPQPKYGNLADRLRFFDAVIERLKDVQGIKSAALVSNLPLGGGQDSLGFHIAGRPDPESGAFSADFNLASVDYFRTMGIPVRQGRTFVAADTASAPGAIVLNETAARTFWPDGSPLGRQIVLPTSKTTSVTLTVVGVTGDVRHAGLWVPARAELFLHTQQANLPWPWLVLVAKTTLDDPLALATTIKGVAHAVDPIVPVERITTMDDVLSASIAEPRVYTLLLGIFAAVALTLATVGLYGVISYGVSQRTRELGIRLALGAARAEIATLVVRESLTLAVVGAVVGLAGSVAALRVLGGIVRGLEPADPVTLGGVIATLFGVALAASYAPARRASRVDPIAALRAD